MTLLGQPLNKHFFIKINIYLKIYYLKKLMENKAIIHLMTKTRMNTKAFKADLDSMEELNEKYGINSIIFYKWEKVDYIDMISKLEKFGIFVQNYSNKAELKEKIADFKEEYKIIFVYTAMELLINTVNEIRQLIWQVVSDYPNIFRDKSLQRELIQKHNPELGIKFLKWKVEDFKISEIEKKIAYPFIIKPIDWVQSSWVQKIEKRADFKKYIENYESFRKRLKDRWIDNKELIIEEFIDWNLYTLDYFVDENWYVYISKPAQEILWIDLWVEDYCVVARMSSLNVELDLKWKRLKTFVNSTVSACAIKNTFVHHEFKLTSKWKLKTIELNWRIGWWRVSLMKKAYSFNLFELIINRDIKPGKLKENNIVVIVYAIKKWVLEKFNNKILSNISRLESVYDISLNENYLWKEVWLTKDWFTKLWGIKLSHKSYKQIFDDYKYIKWKYKNLLILEWDNRWFFNKFSYFFS